MSDYDYQKREEKAVSEIKKAIPSSLKMDMLKISKGLFCELYQNDEVFPNHYMASAIDGVGTKLILAEAMEKYDTVGIDLVAMSANDLATFGKMSPFLFIDYLAVEHNVQEKGLTGDIIKGIVKGLQQCDASKILRNSIRMNFGKGETASVDELMSGVREGYGFDLAGGMIGFIPKSALDFKVQPGQKIIALPSSGLHSNGYTDARLKLLKGDFETRERFKKRYKGSFRLDDDFQGTTIGNALLEPTRIYVKDMARISMENQVIAINNTGYGLKNLNRLTGKFQFVIDDPIEPPAIFKLIQQESRFSDEEMYRKFNMGMGFFVIADSEAADNIINIVPDAKIVGSVEKSAKTQTVLKYHKKNIIFQGY
jgi:phosphoribosylformylglycinamidine cyclo-ligase